MGLKSSVMDSYIFYFLSIKVLKFFKCLFKVWSHSACEWEGVQHEETASCQGDPSPCKI